MKQACLLHRFLMMVDDTRRDGVADLYTSELGTSPPPDLGTTKLAYIRIRQNRHRYNMEYRK